MLPAKWLYIVCGFDIAFALIDAIAGFLLPALFMVAVAGFMWFLAEKKEVN